MSGRDVPMAERTESPGGYVVVLFGSSADEWCTLNKCPMGTVQWFESKDEARRYADSAPGWSEPHILRVETTEPWA